MHIISFLSVRKTLSFALCLGVYTTVSAQDNSHIRYADPFIGTTKSGVLTKWGGNGGTYPGAVFPSGSIQLSPETRVTGARGYDYSDSSIYFFSCIKHYSGFPEGSSGRINVFPVRLAADFVPGASSREFSHKEEIARPGYYKVVLKDDHTVVEVTAIKRSGMFRFTFPAGVLPQLFVGDAGKLSFPDKRTLHGSTANAVMNFSEDLLEKKQLKDGYLFTFKNTLKGAKVITMKISTSTVDAVAAQNNIGREIGQKGFDELRKRSMEEWDRQLATVDITDADEQHKTVFYTALYHSLLIPWVVSDVDGKYRGADGQLHQTKGKCEYGGFSPWDTFRSLHPLLSLLYPEKQEDVILSMLDVYQQTGHLPTESMTGNHAVPIIVDAYLKGIRGYDQTLAYTAMKKNLMEAPFVQDDMEVYHQMGYVPFSNAESVTRTVEYAYNDWALGQYARLVMHNEEDYQLEERRALNYRNLFHTGGLFMLPRKNKDFKPEPGMTGYKEGNKWVYSYFVPHNGKDLVNLMGGNAAFAARLDSAMTNNVILYDNETVIHLPYLFNTAGYPDLTQKWIRDIMLNRFAASPAGLPGNDDLGSMSSAYLFNAMGIFPVSPGRPLYAVGAPLFQSLKLHLANGKTFTIEARGQSRDHPYVKSLQLNRQPYEQLVISHDAVAAGGTLQFEMSGSATETWPKDRNPVALSETKTSAAIRITGYHVTKTRVAPDEQFWVRFDLANKGSLGTEKVVVYINGKPEQFKHCVVPLGTTITDSISCRLYEPGKVSIGLTASEGKNVMVAEPSNPVEFPFRVSELKLKPVVPLHAAQKFSYELQNLTGKKQAFLIPVKINSSIIFTDTVVLAPGKKKLLEHSFTVGTAGLQTLTADREAAKFKVYDSHLSSLLLDLSLVKTDDETLADRSGFENDGLIIGKSDSGTGKSKPVLLGEDSFVEIPNAPSLDQLGETLTMMCWVYPAAGNDKGLIDMLTKGDHHVLQTNNGKTLTFFAGGWGRGDITIDLPEKWKEQWHHLAGVCKGDMLWLYVDGKLSGSAKVDGTVNLSADSKWEIGRNEEFPSERVFQGYIDQVKVYEQALTAEEVSAVMITGGAP
ncbi:GH92 family glycosyl hydrolase [Pedobacter hartonius]|uniref:Alpha-1,2-mannosidase, putative n=1 Tax=Pedobacter hartonius TaxID=425514 RepID=A0A1H4G622_9SPHI|nr:GH92 family glycosyl hydrolase [Pedobacter hartonius]SEB04741.1 alpha-1,2-mannosidase, putative [Pedobacter hartonius]